MLSKEKKIKLEANIRKYYLSSFVTALWFSAAVFILFYQHFGLSYFQIGVIEMSIALFALFLEVPSGAFADIVGRKWSVTLGMLGLAGGLLAFGLSNGFMGFLFASLVIAVGASFLSGADTALLYDTLKCLGREKEFLKIKSTLVLFFYAGITLATYFGVKMFSVNIRLPYYASCVIFLIGALIAVSMEEPYQCKTKFSAKRQLKQMKDGFFQLVKHDKLIWLTLMGICLGIFVSFFHNIVAQPYVLSLGFEVEQFGWIFTSIFLITGLFMSQAVRIEKYFGEKKSFYGMIFMQFVTFLLMYMFSVKLAVLLVLLQYMMWEYNDVLMQTYMHEHIKSSHRATVISIQRMIFGSVVVFVYLILGKLTDMYTMSTTFMVSAIAVLIVGLSLLHVRYSKKLWKKLD